MKSIKSFLILSLMAFINLSVIAQTDTEPKKKLIIVKKTDIDGKVTEQRQEAEGAEVDILMKEIENDADKIIINDLDIVKDNKTVTISRDGDDMKKIVIIKRKDGENKVIEWSGNGEMPAEMAKEMENVDIKTSTSKDGNTTIIVNGEGNELSKDMKKKVYVIEDDHHGNHNNEKEIRLEKRNKGYNNKSRNKKENKVTLGLILEDRGNGVVVDDIVSGSPAAKSGIRRGDIVLKIDKTYIFSSDGLISALRSFQPGDNAKLTYIRNGKEITNKVKF